MSKKYYLSNREKILEKHAVVYLKTRDEKLARVWGNHLRKYFPNSTGRQAQDIYLAMFDSQKGLCMICGKPETKIDRQKNKVCRLAVDHCKETGHVRGLLCFVCNTTLGRFERNLSPIITYLRNAKISYIRKKTNG